MSDVTYSRAGKEDRQEILAAIGGAIASFFTGLPAIVWVLIAVMSIDYLTGIICGLMGKSPNTENGGVSSKMAFRGLLKKALIILVFTADEIIQGPIRIFPKGLMENALYCCGSYSLPGNDFMRNGICEAGQEYLYESRKILIEMI